MIKFLGIALLVLTFIQSVIGLDKEHNKKYRPLSWTYFLILLFGVIYFLFDESEKNKINGYVNNTNITVDNLKNTIDSQMLVINKNLNKTYDLIRKSDSLNIVLLSLSENQENLIYQNKLINKKFNDEINLENTKIQERSALIEINRSKTAWDTTSNNTCRIKLCIENIGSRNAVIEKGKGYLLFFKDNKIKGNLLIPGNSLGDILRPQESVCFYSNGIINYTDIFNSTDYIIIMLEIKYNDVLFLKTKPFKSYTIWIPNDGFGGPKDWQVNVAKSWEKSNFIF